MRILALILVLLATPLHAFPVARCINLGNALEAPTEGDWGYVIERHHLTEIAAKGFDTVRLPARFSAHWDGRIDPAFLARVDEVIGWARAEGLRVILDLHHFDELMHEPRAHADAFLAIWKELSEHYAGAPADLIFELLNEPSWELTTEKAVVLYERAMPTIRALHPDRWVIIGGGRWSVGTELPGLPVFDERTVHTFHYYTPFDFTHQQATYMESPPPARSWGSRSDRAEAVADLVHGLAHDAAPVFLGEFGVYRAAPEQDTQDWLAFVRATTEAAGVGWCAWSFGSSFGIYDSENDRWKESRLKALIPGDR